MSQNTFSSDSETLNELNEECSLHTCRTELPNIVGDLGLNLFEHRLYCHFKSIAWDTRSCNQSNATIASICGMCEKMVRETKKRLEKPRAELGGKSLIRINKTKKQNGFKTTDSVTIVNIWPENFAHINEIKKKLTIGTTFRHGSVHSTDNQDVVYQDKKEQQHKKAKTEKFSGVKASEKKVSSKPVVVFLDLEKVEISLEAKEWICKKYSEEEVSQALKFHRLQPRIDTTLEKKLKWILKAKPKLSESKEEIANKHKLEAEELEHAIETSKRFIDNSGHFCVDRDFVIYGLYQDQQHINLLDPLWSEKIRSLKRYFNLS